MTSQSRTQKPSASIQKAMVHEFRKQCHELPGQRRKSEWEAGHGTACSTHFKLACQVPSREPQHTDVPVRCLDVVQDAVAITFFRRYKRKRSDLRFCACEINVKS